MYVCMCVCVCVCVCGSHLESFTSWHFQGPPAPKTVGADAALDASALLPSVLCAIEMALLQIVAQSMEVPLMVAAVQLSGASAPNEAGSGPRPGGAATVHSHAHLNALLTRTEKLPLAGGEPRGPVLEAGAGGEGWQDACSVIKVKVGGNSPVDQQAARVRAIVDQARAQHQRIRLDANQCWTLLQVVVRPALPRPRAPPCPPSHPASSAVMPDRFWRAETAEIEKLTLARAGV